MICIPYYINGTEQTAQFRGEPVFAPSFIIERNNNDWVRLFHFKKKISAFNTETGMGEDFKNVTIIKDESDFNGNLKISLRSSQSEVQDNLIDGRLLRVTTDHVVFVNLSYFGQFIPTIVPVTVTFVMNDNQEYKFYVNIAQRHAIRDVVIDFGSEASQVWIAHRNDDAQNQNNQGELFELIRNEYEEEDSGKINQLFNESNAQRNENARYYQRDDDNGYLYKSLFFLSSRIGDGMSDENLIRINKEDDILELLRDARYMALPNLKLMLHGEIQLPFININGRGLDNLFKYVKPLRNLILSSIIKAVFNNQNIIDRGNKIAVRVVFLIPNTYSIEDAIMVRKEISQVIDQIVIDDEQPIMPHVEVSTFSESDASFLGYVARDEDIITNGRYLLIDIGKGTTDFSVMQMKDSGDRAYCLARSGIVGAGNVMTFATLVSVLHALDENATADELRNFIIERITSINSMADKNTLYSYLEKIKCNSPSGTGISLPNYIKLYKKNNNWNGGIINKLSLIGLNNCLKGACDQRCFVPNDDSVTRGYANILAQKIVNELKYVYDERLNDIDKLIFAGRGSRSRILRNAIEEAIKSNNPELRIMTSNDVNLKIACLRGPLAVAVKLDTDIAVKQPMLRKQGEATSISHKNQKKLVDDLLYYLPFNKDAKKLDEAKTENAIDVAPSDRFSMGSWKYSLSELKTPVKVCCFFDGDHFLYRSSDSVYKMKRVESPENYSLVYETLFPSIDYERMPNRGDFIDHAYNEMKNVIRALPATQQSPDDIIKQALDAAINSDDSNNVKGNLKVISRKW